MVGKRFEMDRSVKRFGSRVVIADSGLKRCRALNKGIKEGLRAL